MLRVVSTDLPRALLNYDSIQDIHKKGIQHAIPSPRIIEAYDALTQFLEQEGMNTASLESGVAHRLLQQIQLLIGSGALDFERIQRLHVNLNRVRHLFVEDPALVEPITSDIAIQVFGMNTAKINPAEVETTITDQLLTHAEKHIASMVDALKSPARRGIEAYQKMQRRHILSRMLEALRKLFQGKHYKSYTMRCMENDVRAWLNQSHDGLGFVATCISEDAMNAAIDVHLTTSFPDADAVWLAQAKELTHGLIREAWRKNRDQFVTASHNYVGECELKISAMLKEILDISEDGLPKDMMASIYQGQDNISEFWRNIDIQRLTMADVGLIVESCIFAHQWVCKKINHMVEVVENIDKSAELLMQEIDFLRLNIANIAPEEFESTHQSIKALQEKVLKGHLSFSWVPGLPERLQKNMDTLNAVFQSRCETEIARARSWRSDLEQRLNHTIKKHAKTSKNMTEMMKKAPEHALAAAVYMPENTEAQSLLALHEHCKSFCVRN